MKRLRADVFTTSSFLTLCILIASSLPAVGQTAASELDARQTQRLLYQSSVAAAEKSLRLHETRDARRWLEVAPADYRGWEWQHMNAKCDESIARFPMGEALVTSIDLLPNGSLLAVGRIDGSVTLYQMPEFKELRQIGDHQNAIYSVSLSADGTKLATVSRDVTSRVWDVATGAEISRIKLDNPGVAEACFSPNGERVATCTWLMTEEGGNRTVKGVVWVWDAKSGEILAKKHVGVKPLDSLQWSSDGSKIVVGSWGGLVHVLDEQANELRTLQIRDEDIYNSVLSVAISPDGKLVAAGSKDRTGRIWRIEDGELQATMKGHEGFVNAISFVSDSRRIVTASVDGTIRIWNSSSGDQLQVLHGHAGSVVAMDLTSDDQVVSAGRDQELRVWDSSATYGGRLAVRIENAGTYSTTFSPDGTRLFVACFDGHVRILDTQTGKIVGDWIAHSSSCNSLSLSRDGTRLLTCSWDKSAKLWNTADRSLLATLDAKKGVTHCAISPDGKLAGLCVEKDLQIWDIDRPVQIGVCTGHDQSLIDVVFSPNGESIATSAQSGPARVWNAKTNELLAMLGDPNQSASTVAFSHDGRCIATGRTGNVSVWDGGSYQLKKSISVNDSSVSRLAFSPDDKRLAVGSDVVTIIDPDQGTALLRFQPNDDTIYFLAFSPDGARLASCTASGSIAISETTSLQQRWFSKRAMKEGL